jgi:dipeptidyl aminopeptidase/acylaminoacyl peptidase
MIRFARLTLALAAFFLAEAVAADAIPIKDFVRHAEFSAAKISPDGRYLAITVQRDKQDALAVLDLKDMSLLKQTVLPDEKSVGAFYWVGPKRLVFTAVRNLGRFAAPFSTGEWFAMDADGSRPRVLISYETKNATQRGNSVSYADSFSMLDPLPADEDWMLMNVSHQMGDGVLAQVVSVNTASGQRRLLAQAPVKNCSIALDAEKQPRFASCSDDKGANGQYEQHVDLYRRDDKGDWTLVNRSKTGGRRLVVLGSAKDGRIYALEDDSKAPAAFGTIDQKTGAFQKLFQDPVSEPAGYVTASDGDTVLGVVTRAGAPRVSLVDESQPDAQVYVNLAAAFPGKFVDFSSATLDGRQIVVSVSSDSQPTELYLFDRGTGKARFLIRDRMWLDGKRMATIRPFSFTARDGLTLYGYLTIPNGSTGKNLPMIVNPHGGPIGPRDDWGFNWETQLFASRGYLVLQINFRGSGGFGNAFQEKGHREWGGKMQDDLTDATQWAIKQGLADPNRICVYGGSYGGYAALMGAIKEPALYKCAVGYVGVYDLNMMYKKGDIPQRESGKRFLQRTLGPDNAELKKNSPASLASKVTIPVFLAAGLRDQRAPREQTEAMRDALVAAGHPPDEVILQEGEGHGFYSEDNNLNLYTKMLAFFDSYIGTGKGKVEVGAPTNATKK